MNAFPKNGLDMISVLPNIMFALVFQNTFFSIYKGLRKPSDKRITMVTGAGVGFCTVLYILIGLMGYCLFGSDNRYVSANFLI